MNDEQGFLAPSKLYMEYNERNIVGKIRFWIRIPRAYYRWLKQVR